MTNIETWTATRNGQAHLGAIVTERRRGVRKIACTDWPVTDVVERHGRGRWIILRGLCNGVPDRVERYSTRRAALDAL